MTTKALYPTIEPSLELDFANTKALDPRISFTRASTGTYVGADGLIKTAGNGVARFDHNPVTGESLGLLVEEARTNLVTYSQAFNDTNYFIGYDGGGFTENATVAPDGTLTASKLTRNAGNTGAFWGKYNRQFIPVTNGTAYTLSCFLKAAEITTVRLHGDVRDGGGLEFSAAFTLTGSGSYVLSNGTSAQISSAGNGWYRCSVTGTSTSTQEEEPALIVFGTGASGDGFFAWGFQLEAGAFPTSYIPTVASTVTRAADVASITGTNFSSWYRQDEGTLLAIANAYNANAALTGGFNSSVWGLSLNPGSSTTYASLWRSAANNNGEIFVRQSNVTQALLQPISPIAASAQFKQIVALKQDNFASSNNGSSVAIDTSGTLPSFDQLVIGGNFAGGSGAWNSTIARLAYYPVRLPDAQLQALTAT